MNELIENESKVDMFNSTKISETIPSYSCYCSESLCMNSNCTGALRCFTAEYHDVDGYTFSKGCIQDSSDVEFQCHVSFFNSDKDFYSIKCCKGDFCNNGLSTYQDNSIGALQLFGICFGSIFILLCFGLLVYFIIRRRSNRRRFKYGQGLDSPCLFTPSANSYRDEPKATAAGDSTLRGVFAESMTSGSGFGVPIFMQRTIAKDIQKERMIGKGRFGEVWKGTWQGDPVAVKIFSTRDESSWQREKEIYSTILLPNENILGFFGADVTSSAASTTQMWLIMNYHPNGSLYDYLHVHSLDHQELMQILVSTVSGVLHLHTEISGVKRKPAIAHRDLKTKNILVKDDGTCCIADFGLAVMHMQNGEVNLGTNPRAGTRRYMSPELLEDRLNYEMFDHFRKSDIYSLALVMWECCNLCKTTDDEPSYLLPYGGMVPSEPTMEQMRFVICDQGFRPPISQHWMIDPVQKRMGEIIKECWHPNPDVRLSALRIKKDLMALKEAHQVGY